MGSIRICTGVAMLWSLLNCLGTQAIASTGQAIVLFDPVYDSKINANPREQVEDYLKQNSGKFHLDANLANIKFIKKQTSLIGTHYTYQQMVGSLPLADSEIKVSIDKATGKIYRVYSNTKDASKAVAQKKSITERQAYDIAWNHLKVSGKLLHAPRAHLRYLYLNYEVRMSYSIHLPVSEPHGYWIYEIDAVNGNVLDYKDHRVHLSKSKRKPTYGPRQLGPMVSRQQAFLNFYSQPRSKPESVLNASGSGLVFDPDPRTSLNNANLQDNSSPEEFNQAYKTIILKDISQSNGRFSLSGPWVTIDDFDPPTNPPSTSPNGKWTQKRGDNAFNDVMTYYHIDKNQRYIQSLGFIDETGIQQTSIRIDSDGANGADNSYYQPSTNTISFGHGCVDDNEDADVILHEYGHAIHHSINENWNGGDTGAIGEGFGDYWAGSYSYSFPEGQIYFPDQVFSWDGHGEGSPCWPGRTMNAVGLSYDHTRNYGAHEPIEGGYQSDELWSTPIFQSLKQLMDAGVSREDVDRIILESHFGLGSGIKMRDLAMATVQTARTLYGEGIHADILISNFSKVNILEIPHVALALTPQFMETGTNGAPDPGETISINLGVTNTGTLKATAISGTIAGSEQFDVISGQSQWPDIDIGETASNLEPLKGTISPDLECGEIVQVEVILKSKEIDSTSKFFKIETGVADGAKSADNPDLDIPDNDAAGVSTSLEVTAQNHVVTGRFTVQVNLEHTYVGDLILTLVSPQGTSIVLHDRSGGNQDNLVGVYPESLTPSEDLGKLKGEKLSGTWTLRVSDREGLDAGKIVSWGIEDIVGYQCDQT